MLKNFGITSIQKASNLKQAQDICEKCDRQGSTKTIDFAIVDLVPHNKQGFEFLNWTRYHKSSNIQYLPIIFTTNDARERIILNGRDHGANEILIKPYTAQNISKRILSIINNPRNFVKSEHYYGPNRRRKLFDYNGIEKRVTKSEDIRVVYEEQDVA